MSIAPVAEGEAAAPATPHAFPRPGSARPAVAVLTDAAGAEDGGAMGGCWRGPGDEITHAFHATFTPEQCVWRAICAKELLTIVTWLERFGPCYRDAVVLFGTDNAGNVFSVNRLRVDADDTVMSGLLSRLLEVADACNIECLVWWCPRSLNAIADALSKCPSPSDARRVARDLNLALH